MRDVYLNVLKHIWFHGFNFKNNVFVIALLFILIQLYEPSVFNYSCGQLLLWPTALVANYSRGRPFASETKIFHQLVAGAMSREKKMCIFFITTKPRSCDWSAVHWPDACRICVAVKQAQYKKYDFRYLPCMLEVKYNFHLQTCQQKKLKSF
jgi:hypothetical protein